MGKNSIQTKLHELFHNLAIAVNERELRSQFMNSAGEIFEARTWGWKFLDHDFQIVDCELMGLSDRIINQYQEISYLRDPLMNYTIEHHASVHEQILFTSEAWHHSTIYREVFSRYNIEHLAIAPLLGNGRLLGKVFLTRGKQDKAFNFKDLSQLSTVCTHLSVCLATLRATEDSGVRSGAVHVRRSRSLESPFLKSLTKREQQIADLIAEGLKTAELSAVLGITQNSVKQALKRMFLKLDVSTRAEMVAKTRNVYSGNI
jgi:DNA-binding CsgD family transcriptional regulator